MTLLLQGKVTTFGVCDSTTSKFLSKNLEGGGIHPTPSSYRVKDKIRKSISSGWHLMAVLIVLNSITSMFCVKSWQMMVSRKISFWVLRKGHNYDTNQTNKICIHLRIFANVEWVRSILYEYGKALICKGLNFYEPYFKYSWPEVLANVFSICTPQKPGYHFWSKWALLKLDKEKSTFLPPLGIKNNATFNTAFVLKISVVFSL